MVSRQNRPVNQRIMKFTDYRMCLIVGEFRCESDLVVLQNHLQGHCHIHSIVPDLQRVVGNGDDIALGSDCRTLHISADLNLLLCLGIVIEPPQKGS